MRYLSFVSFELENKEMGWKKKGNVTNNTRTCVYSIISVLVYRFKFYFGTGPCHGQSTDRILYTSVVRNPDCRTGGFEHAANLTTVHTQDMYLMSLVHKAIICLLSVL